MQQYDRKQNAHIWIIILIMSRRIAINRARQLKKQSQRKLFDDVKVRTFDDKDQLDCLKLKAVTMKVALNPQLGEPVLKIRKMAAYKNLAYLSDAQYNLCSWRLFAIHKNVLTDTWIHEQYNKWEDYDAYVNPSITKYLTEPRPHLEECLSFPFMKAIVDRATSIEVQYTKVDIEDDSSDSKKWVNTQTVTQKLEGFKAVLFQHCMDHLDGRTLFHPQVNKGRLQMETPQDQFEKTRFLMRQFNLRIKQAIQQNKLEDEKFKKTIQDYEQRICKTFREETLGYQMFISKLNIPNGPKRF